MPIVIKVAGEEAMVVNGVWHSPRPELEQMLNDDVRRYEEEAYSPATAWPDWVLANHAVQDYNGKWVDEGVPPKYEPGRVY